MTTVLFFNDNMSSSNELVTQSTMATFVAGELVGFAANTIELFDNTTTYSATERSFDVGIVWETAAGIASGNGVPSLNNNNWDKKGDSHWFQKYDDSFIYTLNDVTHFKHSVIGNQLWELTTSTDTVVNGAFAADTNWTKGTADWTIAAGVASRAVGAASDLTETVGTLTVGVRYRITYTVLNYVAGTITVKAGSGASGTARSANGTFTEEIVASGSTVLTFTADAAANLDIDNVIALEAGISPEDNLTKWTPMFEGNYIRQYNETNTYKVDDYIFYTLGDNTQNGLYKCLIVTTAGQDPIDTPASWDSQENIDPADVSPLTTKGDLWVYTTVDARLAVGADGLVLTADAASTSGVKWNAVAGTGDVVGPASATNLAIAKYNGATGKSIQNSAILIDASDNMTGATSISCPLLVTASNTDLVLTPNGTGVIKMGKDFDTNSKDIISAAATNITSKPGTTGEFDIEFAAPTTAGIFRVQTSLAGKRQDAFFSGFDVSTTLPSAGGVVINLDNKNSTDGNYTSIIGRDDGGTGIAAVAFKIDSHASNQGSLHLFSANGSLADGLIIEKDGHVTKPLTSAFLANLSATSLNVTGDATEITIVPNTEIYDQNSDYNNTTGTFTAPVTGRYNFSGNITFDDVSDGVTHTAMRIALVTSNRTYNLYSLNPDNLENSNIVRLPYGFKGCDMDAGDTATVAVVVEGATKIVDLLGGGSPSTSFQGNLAF